MNNKQAGDPRVDLGLRLYMQAREALIKGIESSGFSADEDVAVVYASFLASIAGLMTVEVGVGNAQMAFDLAKKATTGAARSSLRRVPL